MIYTTLNRIRAHHPCAPGWEKLLRHLGKSCADDEPLALLTVLESNGLDDALWCLRAEPQHASIWRLYAVRCARRVEHLLTGPRFVAALNVAERHAMGKASADEMAAAWDAGWDATSNADEAAAWAAAKDAAKDAAPGTAMAAARGIAGATNRDAQVEDFRVMVMQYDASPGCEIHDLGQKGGA